MKYKITDYPSRTFPTGKEYTYLATLDGDNYKFDLDGMAQFARAELTKPTGAAQVGTEDGSNVQAELDARVKSDDLASPGGAGQVGTTVAGGSVSMTVAEALDLSSVDLLTRIPKSEWAAIAARTSVYDCTPALISAVATGKRVTISMPGRYKLGTAYVGTTDFDVEALCDDVEFDLSGIAAPVGIQNIGSLSQVSALASSVARGSSVATFESAPSLQPGDWFCVYNPTDHSYSGWREYYRAGEWKRVLSVADEVVTTTQPFYDDYSESHVDIYRLDSVICRLVGVRLIGSDGPPATLLRFALCDGPIVERVAFDVATGAAISINRCVGGYVKDSSGLNRGGVNDEYGIVVGNSQHVRIFGGDVYSRRHAVALGGGNEVGCVPVRDVHIYDAILRNDPNTNVGAADMHGNVEHCSYERCTIYGGASIGGGDGNWYKDCRIQAPGGSATAWVGYFREIKGGQSGFDGCDMHTFGNPQSDSSRGVIDINGNSVTGVGPSTESAFTPTVRNCRLTGPALTENSIFMTCNNRGAFVPLNPQVDGLTLVAVPALGSVLRTNNAEGGVATSEGIVVDNIAGAPAGVVLHAATGSHYRDFPHRLQRQLGVWTGTSAAATSVISAAINFPMLYPRKPQSSLSLSGSGTGMFNGQVGGQLPNLSTYQLNGTSIRPQIRTTAAMTADASFEVSWAVEIREC